MFAVIKCKKKKEKKKERNIHTIFCKATALFYDLELRIRS